MFLPTKMEISKPLKAPPRQGSIKKFKSGFDDQDICNRSFDTAQNLLEKSGKKMTQTKLCLRKKPVSGNNQNHESGHNGPGSSKRNTATVEFVFMPHPKPEKSNISKKPLQESKAENHLKPCNDEIHSSCEKILPVSSNSMENYGRNKRVIMGRVDFCLKIHKLHPNLNILWEVYGKIVKILRGKNRGENILLLRTSNDRGPVLQSIFYDFNNILQNFSSGTCLRAVGEFVNENRLRTFHLENYDCEEYDESAFTRIQNVISFALVQENV